MTKRKEIPDNIKRKGNEIGQLKSQLIRALADYDNLSKRVEKEREAVFGVVGANILNKFLPILDMFDSAQTHLNDPGLAIAIGEFRKVLEEEGLEEIKPNVGDDFDEKLHEVLEVVEGGGERKIAEVVLNGWKFKDLTDSDFSGKVIRHAKVKVYNK